MKKIRNLILTFLLMFVGVVSASALSYTAYESGDEINVSVNDNEKIKFYVVENSDTDSDVVTAITYDFVDQNKYTFEEAETLVNTQKGIWKNVNSLSLPSAKKLLNVEVNLENEYSSENFTQPTWVSPKTTEFTEYWLSEVAYNDAHAVINGMDTYYNSQFHLSSKKDTDKIYVKLLIEVSKKYVEGGVTTTLLDEFVERYKTTELFELYGVSATDVEIKSTDNSLSIVFKKENEIFVTDFTYENGILKYNPASKTDEMILMDVFWQMNAMYALSDLKGYNINRVSKWFSESDKKTLTLEKDGIEYESKDYSYKGEKNGVSTTIDATIFTSLQLDIENGFKSYNEESIAYYEFIEGQNQKYKVDETKELNFIVDGEYTQFEDIYVNGKVIESSNYTVSKGSIDGKDSTVIVLNQSYLDTLNNGIHTVRVTYKDGEFAETTFTVEKTVKNPSTGIVFKCGIFVLIGIIGSLSYLLIRKQSRFPKHN